MPRALGFKIDLPQKKFFLYGGSAGEFLQRILEDTFNIADDASFTFTTIWVPRALNERADIKPIDIANHSARSGA